MYCAFALASQDRKREDGTYDVDFVKCVAWRGTAELMSRYVGKGRLVIVEGRPKTRSWTNDRGEKRSAVELMVENVFFADSKPPEQRAASEPAPASGAGTPPDPRSGYEDAFAELADDDDLPF